MPPRPADAPWVLLRGLSRAAAHWGAFAPQLERGTGRRVLCIDLPGNGSEAALDSPLDIDAMAAHVRRRLAGAGVDTPVHLLALSMGGMLACHWADRWPRELRSAVLVNSSLRGFSPWYRRLRPPAALALLRLVCTGADDARWEEAVYTLTSQRPAQREATLQRWIALRRAQPVARANLWRQLVAAARFRAPPRAPAVPLLVCASAADRLVDPACSRTLAERWQARLAMHPSAGHDLPLDEPDWLIGQLRRWLAEVESPTR